MLRSTPTSKKSRRNRATNFSQRFPVLEPLEARQLLSAAVTFTNVGVGGGGGMYKPRISPFNPQDVYISSDQGDLFFSSNFGQSWTTVNFQEAVGGQNNPLQFTNDSRILYDIQNGGAVSKSTDSGQTWNIANGWTTIGTGSEGFALQIQGDLTNANIIFAVTSTTIWESTNGGNTFTALTGLSFGSAAPYIAGEFNNGTNIYLGTSAGLLILGETGTSWTAGPSGLPSGEAMVSMTGALSAGTTRLAAVVTTASSVSPGIDDLSGFAYSDPAPYTLDVGGTNTWTQKNTSFFGNPATHTGQFAAYIQMVNGDINTLIASGSNSSSGGVQVYKSTNGGTTWTALMQLPATNVNTGSSSDIGAAFGGAAQGIAVDPANANYIMVSNNVGDWASSNGGTTWQEVTDTPATLAPLGAPYSHGAYNGDLNPTSVWGLTFINQQNIFANFTDIEGVHSTDGGTTWAYPTWGGAGTNTIYATSYDARTGLLYGAFSSKHDMFMTTANEEDSQESGWPGFIGVSSDMGATWSVIHPFSNDPVLNILVDPNTANKAYALVGGAVGDVGGVYVTTDLQDGASAVWTKLPDPPRTENHPWDIQELTNGNLLVSYGPTYNTTTGQEDASSGVFLWNASSSTWTDLFASYTNLQYDVRDVYIDPQDPTQQTFYASLNDQANHMGDHGVVGQHPNSGVWKTTNGGTTWTQIFAADGAMSVTINPATHEMYVASQASGVWYSSNANAAIPTFNQLAGEPFAVPTRVYIDPFNPNQVWVTTFGDGVLVSNTTAPGLPGTPTGLTAQTLSSTQVKLTWADNDVPAPQGYTIDDSTDALTWTTVATINSATDLSAIISGLTANTSYYFRVKAFNAFGTTIPDDLQNANENAITVKIDSGTGILAYDGFNDATIGGTLSGTNGSGGTGWANNWSGPSGGLTTISSGSLTESITNPGGTLTTSGNSVAETQQGFGDTRTTTATIGSVGTVFWASVLFTVSDPISLNIGTLSFGVNGSSNWYLNANGHNEGTSTTTATNGNTYLVVIRVDDETGATKYAMWIDPALGATAPDYSTSVFGNVTDTSNNFSPTTSVSIGGSPYFTTANVDEIRIGTTYASVVPGSAPAVPSAPTGLVDTVVSPNEIDLTWTALASDQKGFHIQYSTNGSTYTTLDTVNNASATSYKATNLAAGTQYWFRVTGFNDTGDSTASGVVTNTTLIPAPAQPTNLAAATTSASSNVNLTWTDNATNEANYKVYYTTNARNSFGQATWTLATTLAANSTSYSVTGLTANTLYYFKVSAINSTGETFSPITSGVLLAAPSALNAVASSFAQIDLNWTNNSTSTTGYQLQYSTDNATWTTVNITNPATTTYALNILSANTQYYFRVSATGPSGSSAFSSVATARTLASGGLVASEDFSYPSGVTVNTANGGTGWATAWSGTPAGVTVASSSLTGPTGLLTSANHLNITQQDSVSRTTSTTFGANGTTTWFSFLVTIPSDDASALLQLGTNANPIQIGNVWNGTFGVQDGNDLFLGGSVTAVAGQTYFIVASIDNEATSETYNVWVNPTPGLTSPSGTVEATRTITADDFQSTNAVKLQTGTYSNSAAFDELRIGTSYAAVAPIAAPAAPTGLSATAISTSQINLSWTNPSGTTQTGLHVQRSTDNVTFTTIATINTPTTTTYSDTGLAGSTLYYYRITGFNNSGDSLYSNTANATTQGSIPAAPSGLTATTISQTQINLAWTDNSSNETGFEVDQATNSSFTTGLVTYNVGVNVTAYNDTGLAANTTYYFRVRALGSSGNSAFTSTVNASSLANVPTSLSATAASSSQINLTWSESGTATSYKIYRAPDVSGSPGTFTLDSTSSTTSFSDTGLSASTKYWYQVTAVNSAGAESAHSNQANATTSAASANIASDSFSYSAGSLNGDGTSGSGWAGAWSANSNPTVSTTSLVPTVNLATSGGSFTTTVGGYGATRTLSSALNTNSTVWSSVLITPDFAGPNTPRSGGVIIGNTQVNYVKESDGNYHWEIDAADGTWFGSHWNAGTNPLVTTGQTYYIVLEQIFSGGSDTVYAWINPTPGSTAPTTATAFDTKTGINAGGTLTTVKLNSTYYSNTAFDEVRIGTTFAAVAPLGATAPNAPSALSATAASSSQINLTWTDNATNETGFKVYQSTNGTSFSLIQTIATPNTTSYNVTGLSGSTQYWYEVTAYNSAGESSDSNVATAMTAIAGGIASDSFSYSTGALNGDGAAGNGWAGAWSANSNPTVSTTSLTPSVNLATSGGSFSTTVAGYGATRNLSSALNTNSTVWSSVLITPDFAGPNTPRSGGVIIGNTQVDYIKESDGNYHWDISAVDGSWYGSHYNAGTNPTVTTGQTYFVVLEQIFSGGSDTVYAWINPTPGATAPTTASAFDTKTGVNAGGTLTTVKLTSTYYSNTAFDEVRLGTTFAAVAPPQISGLTVSSTHSSSYSIHNRALATGVSQYGDVTKNFTTIPSQYLGLTYIQTAEADSTSTASNLISFTVYQPTIVYVAFDDAITTKPTWLTSQFTDTGDNIVSAQGTFSIYKMTVSAGLVTLGGPGGTSGQGMYSVLLQSAV